MITDKVITQGDGKVFTFTSELFIFDDIVNSQCTISHFNPVKVQNDDGDVIGFANMETQGNTLIGKFFIDYSTPERFNIETKSVPMFSDLVFDEFDSAGNDLTVNHIVLTIKPPKDSRLSPINTFNL